MKLIEFMASGVGRILRLVAGLVLDVVGFSLVTGPSVVAGSIVGIVGLVPLFAGFFDVCVFAPLFGAPFHGTQIRQQAHLSLRGPAEREVRNGFGTGCHPSVYRGDGVLNYVRKRPPGHD